MKTRTMTRTQAELLLAAVIIARSTSYVLTKVGLQDMGKFTLLAVRFLLAFAFLAALFRRRLLQIDRRTLLSGLAMGSIYFCVMTAELTALKTVETSTVSFVTNTPVVIRPLIQAALSRRWPERRVLFGALACLLGVALLTLRGGLTLTPGVGYCILEAFLYSAAILVTDRLTHAGADPLLSGVVQVGFLGALALIASFLLSLFFELTQLTGLYFIYPGSYRLFDVDDLIINTAGSMAGFALARAALKFLPSREELDRESFVRGRRISLLRRIVAFIYDEVAYAILFIVVFLIWTANFGTMSVWVYALIWLAYFALCPIILRGQTIGHRLTRLRIVSSSGERAHWYQYALRYALLLAVLVIVPVLVNVAVSNLAAAGTLSELASLVAYGLVDGGYLFTLLFEAVRMAMRKPLFYERISRTKLVSTAEEAKRKP